MSMQGSCAEVRRKENMKDAGHNTCAAPLSGHCMLPRPRLEGGGAPLGRGGGLGKRAQAHQARHARVAPRPRERRAALARPRSRSARLLGLAVCAGSAAAAGTPQERCAGSRPSASKPAARPTTEACPARLLGAAFGCRCRCRARMERAGMRPWPGPLRPHGVTPCLLPRARERPATAAPQAALARETWAAHRLARELFQLHELGEQAAELPVQRLQLGRLDRALRACAPRRLAVLLAGWALEWGLHRRCPPPHPTRTGRAGPYMEAPTDTLHLVKQVLLMAPVTVGHQVDCAVTALVGVQATTCSRATRSTRRQRTLALASGRDGVLKHAQREQVALPGQGARVGGGHGCGALWVQRHLRARQPRLRAAKTRICDYRSTHPLLSTSTAEAAGVTFYITPLLRAPKVTVRSACQRGPMRVRPA